MEIIRLIIGVTLAALAAYIAVMNWGCVIASLLNRKKGIDKYHSTVPLISLIIAGVAAWSYPYDHRLWILTIPVVDVSNWMLLCLPYIFLKDRIDKRKHGQPNKTR